MPDHHPARHLASRLAALARALAVRALLAACALGATWPAQAANDLLAPAGAAALPAGRTTAAALLRQWLVDGDRVLLACGERHAPLRLQTRGVGNVRAEPAAPCSAGQRPVFDGRRLLGDALPPAISTAQPGAAGRSSTTQAQAVVQVFAGDVLLFTGSPVRATRPAAGCCSARRLAATLPRCPPMPGWTRPCWPAPR